MTGIPKEKAGKSGCEEDRTSGGRGEDKGVEEREWTVEKKG